jgi:hypothetical protein
VAAAATPDAAPQAVRPRFLQALDNVESAGDGTYVADCPICRDILLIEPEEQGWLLECDGGHTHEQLVEWLGITDLRFDPAWGVRAWICMMLATTPHTWAALLAGEPVNDAALDQAYLARFRTAGILP